MCSLYGWALGSAPRSGVVAQAGVEGPAGLALQRSGQVAGAGRQRPHGLLVADDAVAGLTFEHLGDAGEVAAGAAGERRAVAEVARPVGARGREARGDGAAAELAAVAGTGVFCAGGEEQQREGQGAGRTAESPRSKTSTVSRSSGEPTGSPGQPQMQRI